MKRTALLLLALVVVSPIVYGQATTKSENRTHQLVKVKMDADKVASGIEISVAARLQGTERYVVTEGDAELYLHLTCITSKEFSSATGYVCSFSVSYWPERLAGLWAVIGDGLVTGHVESDIAEDIFTSFVSMSTGEKLERAQKDMRVAVIGYCHSSIFDKNVRADCGQDTKK